jgi:hypothetical protein
MTFRGVLSDNIGILAGLEAADAGRWHHLSAKLWDSIERIRTVPDQA